ncbi:hypothetical protein SAMN04487928_1187 [Butyrivibrio proteoclasticus]|uniref:Glucosyl transferase GtrII n=1 Tax=Butyrivibrio proteoclasticus TaxID=43305 RepID=A0A1I5VM45_9FIRM|nr:hypothetical protein [Butyrivibrio proteoclasticus]SFQ08491.1 hypothetical protein SAMN04487928_1187 [Butyrivibrio proteoclasticus]
MFSYKIPKFNIKLNTRKLSIFFTAVYVLSLIPMLVLGFYDFPSADDFSMALETRQYFVQNGDFFGTVLASLQKSWVVYSQYEGYFFSIILTCICPSVFGESFYFLTPFLVLGMLTFGVCYFFDALFVRAWQLDKDLTNAVRMLTLFMMVQCLNGAGTRVEAFYWYSGAINYTFTFGMAFFWLGLLLRSVYEADEKKRFRKLVWASIWAFFMGGANYLSALELAICSVLLLFVFVMVKLEKFNIQGVDAAQRKAFGRIWIPLVINLIGFSFSCFGPGNSNRFAETTQMSPVKAVFVSLYNTFDMLFNDMTRWEVIVILFMLVPVFWKMAEGLKIRLEHPVLFSLFAFLLVSSNMTPPIFATANIDAGRLKALAFMEFVFMLVLTEFYLTAAARQYFDEKYVKDIMQVGSDGSDTFSPVFSMIIASCIVILALGSALSIKPEPDYYSCTSAFYDIAGGSAETYKQENADRLRILRDDSIKNAELTEYSVHPEMLFYMDVTPDSNEWINQATAKYFDKETTVLLPKNN